LKPRVVCLLACSMAFSLNEFGAERARNDLSCVKFLHLPTHGILATYAQGSGTIYAEIHLGKRGELSRVLLTGSEDRALRGETDVAISMSKFAERCAGRTLHFVFSYILQDPPADSIIPPQVLFSPPNHFELTFRKRIGTKD
jgi:hypothetical protein